MPESQTQIPSVYAARSALGVAARRRDAEAIRAARQELAAANIAAAIKRVASEAPPLTEDQRRRLASILTEDGDR